MSSEKERRATMDRRRQENGPPDGWRERRRSVERRRPEVREILFAEWLSCFRHRLEKEAKRA